MKEYPPAMMQSRTSIPLIFATMIVLQAAFLMFVVVSSAHSQATAGNSVEILTQTDGVDFSDFLSGLCKSVKTHWYSVMPQEASLGTKGKVAIGFQIKRDGSLSEGSPEVEVTSGKKKLDDAAMYAIKHSAPFKRFPQAFKGPGIDLRMTFSYNQPTTQKQ